MEALRFPIDVIVERIPLTSRWADSRWAPCAVLAPEDDADRDANSDNERFRFKGFEVELHRAESEGYWLNLSAQAPKVFVRWRAAEEGDAPSPAAIVPLAVTLSYHEAARWLDGGAEVEAVALPPSLHPHLAEFVAANYKPEPRRKSKRNPFYEEHGPAPRRPPR